ncbi:MAG: MarR family transcriptional regulator [Bacteroidetes bacterium]|nr:MarR family transcriptional regulator [Bacteroidota bacterium]
MEMLDKVIFYHIEKAIKSYRQYAQTQIKQAGLNITIDQWLVLKTIQDEPDIQFQELAVKVFKDKASITRIIALLEKSKYLAKSSHSQDGRRLFLKITKTGEKAMEQVSNIVLKNREHALRGISEKDIAGTTTTLKHIAKNCANKTTY